MRAMIEDLRAWRVVGGAYAIAQNVRPTFSVDFNPRRNWDIQATTAFSSTRATTSTMQPRTAFPSPTHGHFDGNFMTIPDRSCCNTRFDSLPDFSENLLQLYRWSESAVQTVCSNQHFLRPGLIRICLVATFPPSGRQLNEYAFHIAKELKKHADVELTILADELTSYDFATDENGDSLKVGFRMRSCLGSKSFAAGSSARSRRPGVFSAQSAG